MQQLWAESTGHRLSWQGLKSCSILSGQINISVIHTAALPVYLETIAIARIMELHCRVINYMISVTFSFLRRKPPFLLRDLSECKSSPKENNEPPFKMKLEIKPGTCTSPMHWRCLVTIFSVLHSSFLPPNLKIKEWKAGLDTADFLPDCNHRKLQKRSLLSHLCWVLVLTKPLYLHRTHRE